MDKLLMIALVSLLFFGSFGEKEVIYQSELDTAKWVYQASDSGQDFFLGWDEESWDAVLSSLPSFIGNQLPPVDFDQSILLFASLGERPTGGYGININKVETKKGTLVVEISRKSPQPDEFVTMALTYPYDLVILQREAVESIVEVNFVDPRGNLVRKIQR